MEQGARVRMTTAFKAKMRGRCLPGKHAGLRNPDPEMPDEGCMKCSTGHIEEFGECEGVVQGLTDYGSQKGPEVDVRWQPSNLRYAYHPSHLELVVGDRSDLPPDDSSTLARRVANLMEQVKQLPPMGSVEHTAQGLSFAYGNLAASTNHKPQRAAFRQIALERGWSGERFDTWAAGMQWWPQ